MEPVTFVLGLLVVTGCLHVTTRVIADGIATIKAAKAGEWALIDRDHERRAARAERWAKAWEGVRSRRHKQAGGDGTYRPGFRDYLGDVYHGVWEDRLTRRNAKRAARPEYVYDPNRKPWHVRVDEAIADKVGRARAAWGQYRQQRTTDVPAPAEPVTPLVESGDVPVGTVRHTDDGREQWTGAEWAPVTDQRPDPVADEETNPTMTGDNNAPERRNPPLAGGPLTPDMTVWRRYGTCVHPAEPGQRHNEHGYCPGQICSHERHGGGPENVFCCYHSVARQQDAEASPVAAEPISDEPNAAPTQPTGGPMTAPTTTPAADATEVNTNEDARRNFAAMAGAATEAQEALVRLEAARARMAAAAQATQDGMGAKAFDTGATAAANDAVDAIGLDTLGGWAELIEAVKAAADKGIAGLDKYRDSEAQVAEERIDPTVLASTSA